MPQLVVFPYLGNAAKPIDALIKLCKGLTDEGESRKALRTRLKPLGLWDKDRIAATFEFFRIANGDTITASEVTRSVSEAGDRLKAEEALAERMWQCNPILFKSVIDALNERLQSRDDLFIFLGSFAYRGASVARPEFDAWMQLAQEINVFRKVGIGYAIGDRGEAFVERATDLDIDEYLEDDEPEPPLQASPGAGDANADVDAAPTAPMVEASTAAVTAALEPLPAATQAPACDLPSPLGRGRPVPVSRFAGQDVFATDVLEETTTRLEEWWAEQEAVEAGWTGADFGFGAELWMEGAEEALYRIAVAAALAFRLNAATREQKLAAFAALDKAGVLADLYYGTAPDTLPAAVDPSALMLASLVARRCAESPELAMTIEKHSTASEVFASLDESLGRGLFRMELFWIMQVLEEIGSLRLPDLPEYTVMPTRLVRDALFRLGFVKSPYASDATSLTLAAAAAKLAAGEARPAGTALTMFVRAAGCTYDCAQRKQCDFPCRERAE